MLEISMDISEYFGKFCYFEKFLKTFRNITKIFENYFEKFQKKFRNIWRIIMENLEKYFVTF